MHYCALTTLEPPFITYEPMNISVGEKVKAHLLHISANTLATLSSRLASQID